MARISVLCTRCKELHLMEAIPTSSYAISCRKCNFVIVRCEDYKGHIDLLSNPLMPGILKIGLTERDIEQRIQELSGHTGVGVSFVEEARFEVCDPAGTESRVHEILDSYRVNPNREFFRISVEQAIATISGIVGSPPMDYDSQMRTGEKRKNLRQIVKQRMSKENHSSTDIRGGFGSERHGSRG